jgi:hypothetical protein
MPAQCLLAEHCAWSWKAMQAQSFILVAVLLGCLVMAAAAQAPAARHLASTVGGRDDPKVQLVISKQR